MPADEEWRLLPFDAGPSSRHIALSDALVRVGTSPTVWWHSADRATLILGAAQEIDADMVARAARRALSVVKRHAGGASVLATPDVLGLDILLPRGHQLAKPDVVEGYRWLGEVWCAALRAMGADARVVSVTDARATPRPPEPLVTMLRAACFGTLSPYEVTVEGRKVVGLAQVRRTRNILLQAGIHLSLDVDTLTALLAPGFQSSAAYHLRERAAGLEEVLPSKPVPEQIMSAFARALSRHVGVVLAEDNWTASEIAHANQRQAEAVVFHCAEKPDVSTI